jgi:inosine-uridine nucleoside N-ribohydrolase
MPNARFTRRGSVGDTDGASPRRRDDRHGAHHDQRGRTVTRRVWIWLFVAVAVAGCGHGTTGASSRAAEARTPVVVDTDLSTDDILAILYLTQRKDIAIEAVAVSGTGLVRCPRGAANALALLAFTGHGEVPVACGRSDPLAGFNAFPVAWRNAADGFYGLRLPAARRNPEPGGAEALLRRVLRRATTKVAVLSLAPMTDTAAVLRADPSLRSRMAGVYAMGGAVGVPGNIGPGHERVEYNFWIDPEAVKTVFAAGVPVTLVPLDATNDVPVRGAFAVALRRRRGATRAATAAASLLRRNPFIYSGGQYFWDPLAAAAVTAPQLLRFDERRLSVVTEPGGQNGRIVDSPGGTKVRVAFGARGDAFERHLLSTLLGGRPVRIPSPPPTATITFDGQTCRYDGPRRVRAGTVTVDTVDRSGAGYRFVVGTLHDQRTLADLQAAVARAHGRLEPSAWFTPSPIGETPPDGRVTWIATAEPDPVPAPTALACVDATGTARFAGTLLVVPTPHSAARR